MKRQSPHQSDPVDKLKEAYYLIPPKRRDYESSFVNNTELALTVVCTDVEATIQKLISENRLREKIHPGSNIDLLHVAMMALNYKMHYQIYYWRRNLQTCIETKAPTLLDSTSKIIESLTKQCKNVDWNVCHKNSGSESTLNLLLDSLIEPIGFLQEPQIKELYESIAPSISSVMDLLAKLVRNLEPLQLKLYFPKLVCIYDKGYAEPLAGAISSLPINALKTMDHHSLYNGLDPIGGEAMHRLLTSLFKAAKLPNKENLNLLQDRISSFKTPEDKQLKLMEACKKQYHDLQNETSIDNNPRIEAMMQAMQQQMQTMQQQMQTMQQQMQMMQQGTTNNNTDQNSSQFFQPPRTQQGQGTQPEQLGLLNHKR